VLVVGYRPTSCIVDVDWLKVWVGLVGGYRPASCLLAEGLGWVSG